jgi:hypothetical protein
MVGMNTLIFLPDNVEAFAATVIELPTNIEVFADVLGCQTPIEDELFAPAD